MYNQVKEKGLPNKFHGKNFVFDQRLGERITEEIIAQCHQCGKPADTHVNCVNDACHLLFIQCDECQTENGRNCCCKECLDFIHLPDGRTKTNFAKELIREEIFLIKQKQRLRPRSE